jgi:outer membrane protein assembly factor BamB
VELATGKVRWSEENFGAGTLILTERGELMLAMATPEKFDVLARAQVLGSDVRAYGALGNGFFYGRDKQSLVCIDLR